MPSPLRILTFTNLALGGALAAAWLAVPHAWRPAGALPPDAASLEPVRIEAARAGHEALREMVERPPFDPERGAAAADEAALAPAPASSEPLSAARLLGVAQSTDRGTVILRIDGSVRRLRVGERLGEWTLSGLEGRKARFVGEDGQTRELVLIPSHRASAPPAQASVLPTTGGPDLADSPAATADPEDPILDKTFEQRVAERRAMREAMERAPGP